MIALVASNAEQNNIPKEDEYYKRKQLESDLLRNSKHLFRNFWRGVESSSAYYDGVHKSTRKENWVYTSQQNQNSNNAEKVC
jgi:hypothetical protein